MAKVRGAQQVMFNLRKVLENHREDIEDSMGQFAAKLENQAKNNRPWTDRTGNARRSIEGSSEVGRDYIKVALCIGVDYGKYLELSNGGKYRIILPTMKSNYSGFFQAITRRLRL